MSDGSFDARRARRERRRQQVKRARIAAWATALAFAIPGAQGVASVEEPDRMTKIAASGLETTDIARSITKFRRGVFAVRPTPTPSPSPSPSPSHTHPETETTTETQAPPAPAGSITEIIYAAAAEFGVSGEFLLSIASCESGLNPNAVNPAGYYGLFQFDQATWGANGYGSIYDPVAQARTAARLIAAGQEHRWANCL